MSICLSDCVLQCIAKLGQFLCTPIISMWLKGSFIHCLFLTNIYIESDNVRLYVYFQACMLTFYPEFESKALPEPEILIILDMSNSMKGTAQEQAKKVKQKCYGMVVKKCINVNPSIYFCYNQCFPKLIFSVHLYIDLESWRLNVAH